MLAKSYANCVYVHVCTCVKVKGECQKNEKLTVIIELFVTFMSVLLLVREIP